VIIVKIQWPSLINRIAVRRQNLTLHRCVDSLMSRSINQADISKLPSKNIKNGKNVMERLRIHLAQSSRCPSTTFNNSFRSVGRFEITLMHFDSIYTFIYARIRWRTVKCIIQTISRVAVNSENWHQCLLTSARRYSSDEYKICYYRHG